MKIKLILICRDETDESGYEWDPAEHENDNEYPNLMSAPWYYKMQMYEDKFLKE